MRASLLVSVCDEVTGALLDDEVRIRIFPSRGGFIDIDLTHNEATNLAARLLTVVGAAESSVEGGEVV